MLQQTQASRVAGVYEAFIVRFPTVAALASASTADVLRAWGTLGYPRRALRLREAASVIAERGFPRDVDGLRALPGVGAYTARAVAAYAFGAPVAALDVNLRRVLGRWKAMPAGAGMQAAADEIVPSGAAGRWNQAMVDLGATVCTVRDPCCGGCPLRRGCSYRGAPDPTVPEGRATRPRFETTSRYARGRVLAALRDSAGALTERTIVRRTGLPAPRVRAAVEGLTADGLASRRGPVVVLGA